MAETDHWFRSQGVFLGLAGYYRQFVMDFSSPAAPLTKLVHKKEKFIWMMDYEKCFQELTKRLTSAPVLTFTIWQWRFCDL